MIIEGVGDDDDDEDNDDDDDDDDGNKKNNENYGEEKVSDKGKGRLRKFMKIN